MLPVAVVRHHSPSGAHKHTYVKLRAVEVGVLGLSVDAPYAAVVCHHSLSGAYSRQCEALQAAAS